MHLATGKNKFLCRRENLLRYWPVIGSLLLAGILGFAVWLYFGNPLMIDPMAVNRWILDGSISFKMLSTMASLLSVVVLMCLTLAVFIILFLFVALANERRFLRLIRGVVRMTDSTRWAAVR